MESIQNTEDCQSDTISKIQGIVKEMELKRPRLMSELRYIQHSLYITKIIYNGKDIGVIYNTNGMAQFRPYLYHFGEIPEDVHQQILAYCNELRVEGGEHGITGFNDFSPTYGRSAY